MLSYNMSKNMPLGLTNKEFLNQIWLSNPDPNIVRLLEMAELLEEWKELGDTPEDVKWLIEIAEGETRSSDNEVDFLNCEIRKLEDKIESLQARTVAHLISELYDSNSDLIADARDANNAATAAEKERDEMKHKMNMWAVLTK